MQDFGYIKSRFPLKNILFLYSLARYDFGVRVTHDTLTMNCKNYTLI